MPAMDLGGSQVCTPAVTFNTLSGKHFTFSWIPILGFEAILFTLAVYKGYCALRRKPAEGRRSKLSILQYLIADSILYFCVYVQQSHFQPRSSHR